MIEKENDVPFADNPDDGDNRQTYRYLPIKEMCKEDTPRERAEKFGCGVLSMAELWAIILRTGTVGMPITQLCRNLMQSNDNRLTSLERRNRKELLEIKGLGKLKVIQIEAVMELIRRYNLESVGNKPTIKCSKDVYDIMRSVIGNIPHEEIWVLILNRRNQVVKRQLISKGGISASIFDAKLVLKEAILENASAIILCHNHPSGNLNPSKQDDVTTKQCNNACKTMDIQFLDHIIITADGYFSYNDNSRID